MSKRRFLRFVAGASLAAIVTTADAAMPLPPRLDSGATSWVLTASALVLFMTLPGLTLFYGGLVRSSHLPAVLMRRCFVISCVVSLIWLAFGYSLVFATGGQLLGSLDAAFLMGNVGRLTPSGVPEGAFALFQMTFAIITPALIIGTITERARFSFVILFSAVWTALVYLPIAHWVWGNGWLAQMGTVDFAGGIVVHTTAGASALVAAWLMGPREGFPQRMPPHNPAMTTIGAAMLWVGWFGFNGGSALAANASAASAILATQFAAAAAGLVWIAVERLRLGKPSPVGIASGCIAGLATITPASGYVGPIGAVVIGVIAGFVCCIAAGVVKHRFGIDDALDVFGVHGLGGMLGSLLLVAFALPELGGSGYGHPMSVAYQLRAQAIGIGAAAVWSALCTYLIFKLLEAAVGARVSPEEERSGAGPEDSDKGPLAGDQS